MTKEQQRRAALIKRESLNSTFRQNIAQQLTQYCSPLQNLCQGNIISGFWPIGSEIDPRPLLFALQKQNKIICLPAIIDKKMRKMQFRQFCHEDELIPMGFGTLGPPENCPTLDPDLIMLPLAAFDDKGNRIGYGGGFYDRIIADMQLRQKQPFCLGLAFDCQEVHHIAAERHDIVLHGILTETGIRIFN